MTQRVAILISGGGSNMVSLVEDMQGDHPARPVLVVSNVADAGGLEKARSRGIATACVDHTAFGANRSAFEARLSEVLEAAKPDVICLAGFMRVLSAPFVTRWQGKLLNIHPSLLPKYKGLNTHARALAAGDSEAGCSVHEVTAELDGGRVLGQARVPILPDDTPEKLAQRVLAQEHVLYPKILRRVAIGDRSRLDLP
ncbi:phosphoribosylglycinamide formyltransferase [Marivita sp. S0852]|uniref:phosphoribosylglycinamide formyltransferase n=1 Tax=Marivita sp. S0852 TaxID=3373893 RepID=UPI003982316D